jgi:hypothetical protein
VPLAYALSRLMEGLLFGIAAPDVATYAAVAGLLVVVSLAASWVPSRAAARTDLHEALKIEQAARSGSAVDHAATDAARTRGITSSAKRSISSSWGLNCRSSRSTPMRSKSRMRSATWSGVPTRPVRRPRFETE